MKRTPIKRKSPMKRSGEMTRSVIKKKRATTRAKKDTGPSQDVRNLVIARASGRCERCGSASGWIGHQVHHRKPRGLGGSSSPDINLPSNLLLLCAGCHEEIERLDREVAYGKGWLVHREHDPAMQPVLLFGRGRCFLSADGSIAEAPDEAA